VAWQDESIPILRTILNDVGCGTTTYTDTRLEDLLLASAHMVLTQIEFPTTYTVTISDGTITPDPATDVAFINFIVLKAACFADQGMFRQKALLAGVEARCGPAMLKTMQHVHGFQTLLEEGPCKAFEELKQDYLFGNTEVIRAILSPFVGNDFQPSLRATHGETRTDRWFN
jgi:hypothetical protein